MLKTLFICGTFDYRHGKPSKLGQVIADNITTYPYKQVVNGGHFTDLISLFENITDYERVFWFAHVPIKTEVKTVEWIKQQNKTCMLITSKRNVDNKYSVADIAGHAIRLKSNLVLEFTKKEDRYYGRILDPLGNMYLDYCDDFEKIGKTLDFYSFELSKNHRVGSHRHGDAKDVPNKAAFFKLIQKHAKTFSKMTEDTIKTDRFLGNASFRCNRGFPSFKEEDGMIFVSQRNVNKESIEKENFVAVEPGLPVFYYGDHKPSVDTPCQIKLYDYYKKAQYMLHSHVYVKDAQMTSTFAPCGSIDEFDYIIAVEPNAEAINFAINLKGHGSIIIADNLKYIQTLKFENRGYPEYIGEDLGEK